jgi:hypothetical protein
MNPPARPVRVEFHDALVGGIRQRGPEAAGLVIVGLARILIAAVTLALLLSVSVVLGLEFRAALPLASMTGASAGLSWLVTRGASWSVAPSEQKGPDRSA